MSVGTAPKLFGAVEKGIAQLRQTRALKGVFVKRKNLIDTLNSRFGEAEVKATLGDFFKTHPENEIQLDALEKAIKPVPETGVTTLAEPIFPTLGREFPEATNYTERAYSLKGLGFVSPHLEVEDVFAIGRVSDLDVPESLGGVGGARRQQLLAEVEELSERIRRTGTAEDNAAINRIRVRKEEELAKLAEEERTLPTPQLRMIEEMQSEIVAEQATRGIKEPADIERLVEIGKEIRSNRRQLDKLGPQRTPENMVKYDALTGSQQRLLQERAALSERVPALPTFKKSWSMYLFKNELAIAAADPNIKYIGWSSGETVRAAEGAAVGSGTHTYFAKLYDIHLPKNVKNYTSRWGVEPREVSIGRATGKKFIVVEGRTHELHNIIDQETREVIETFDSSMDAFAAVKKLNAEHGAKTAWVLPITDQMRTDILTKGQPIDLKAITIASGAGAMGAVTTQDVQAEQEQKGLGRRVMDAWMGQDPILSLYKNPWIRKGVGMSFGLALSGQAILFGALKADEETRELVKEGKMSVKDRDIYQRKAARDAFYASVFKGGWKKAVFDYYVTVVGESPLEMFKDFKLPIGAMFPATGLVLERGIPPELQGEEVIIPGVIPSTAVFMFMDALSDPLLPVNILAPVSFAIKGVKGATVAIRAAKIVKAVDNVPGLTQKYGIKSIKALAETVAKAPARVRIRFADRLMANKQNSEAFMIGLLDNKQPLKMAPVAKQGGRPVSDMTLDEYSATVPPGGNRETSRFILKEAGVTEKAYIDPKTRVKSQKAIANYYKTAFGISDEVDVLSVPKNTGAVAKVGTDNYRVNIALHAKPIHIAEEMTHVKDMTRGYFGTPDIAEGHFMDIRGTDFASAFVHRQSVRNAINNGDAVRNEVLTDYILQRKDWARAKANLEPLPPQSIPPGLRHAAKGDEALLDFISSAGDSVPPWIRVSDAERVAAGTKLADDPAAMTDIWAKMGSEGVLTDEVVAANIDMMRQFVKVTQNPGNEFLRRAFIDNYAKFSKASSETASTHRWMGIALRRQDVLRDEIRIGLGGTNAEEFLAMADQADPEAIGAFIAREYPHIFEDKPGLGEAVVEYYVNNLLTSLSAHTTNAISNLLFGTYNVFVKHLGTALVDTTLHVLTGREQQVYLGEVLKSWVSLPRNAREGARAAGLVIRKGHIAGMERLGIKYEVRRSWVDTKNVPEYMKFMYNGALRFMMAGDVFFRSAVGGSHLEALAYRAAKRSGGAKTFEDIRANPPQWMWKEAERIGGRTVYFDDPGGFMGKVLEGRNLIPAKLGYIAVPFIHTLTRIVARGIEMTPIVGAVRALPRKVTVPLRIGDRFRLHKEEIKVFKRLAKLSDMETTAREWPTKTPRQRLKKQERMVQIADEKKIKLEEAVEIGYAQKRVLPETIVDQITGLLIAIPAYNLYSKGKITGSYPTDPEEKKEWKIQGKTPFSIQTGRGWRRYNDAFGPFGYPLAAWVSTLETLERRKKEPLTGEEEEKLLESFALTARDVASYIRNNTFLRNAMESVDAITGLADEPVKYAKAQGERWFGNTLSGFAPYAGLVRQFNRARTAYDVGQTVIRRPEGVVENFAASLGFGVGDIVVDFQGRPAGNIERVTEEGGRLQAALVQFFPIVRARFPKANDVDIAFLISGYIPGYPNRNIDKIRLNKELYRQLQIARGRELSKNIAEYVQRPSWKALDQQYRRGGKGGEKAQVRMNRLLQKRVTALTTKVRTRFKRRPDVRRYLEANRGD